MADWFCVINCFPRLLQTVNIISMRQNTVIKSAYTLSLYYLRRTDTFCDEQLLSQTELNWCEDMDKASHTGATFKWISTHIPNKDWDDFFIHSQTSQTWTVSPMKFGNG